MASILSLIAGLVVGAVAGWFLRGLRTGSPQTADATSPSPATLPACPARKRTAPVAGVALAIAAVGAATILGAYYFEYVLHYQPCPLCLEQRIPYYVGIPLALVVALAVKFRAPRPVLIVGFAGLALAMAIGASSPKASGARAAG